MREAAGCEPGFTILELKSGGRLADARVGKVGIAQSHKHIVMFMAMHQGGSFRGHDYIECPEILILEDQMMAGFRCDINSLLRLGRGRQAQQARAHDLQSPHLKHCRTPVPRRKRRKPETDFAWAYELQAAPGPAFYEILGSSRRNALSIRRSCQRRSGLE